MTPFERARAYARATPPAISEQGGHNQTFSLAMALLHGFQLSQPDALAILQTWNMTCLPPWHDGELRHKVNSAAHLTPAKPTGWLLGNDRAPRDSNTPALPPAPPMPPKWPAVDPELVLRIAAAGGGLPDLWEASPVRFDDGEPQTENIIDALYPPGALLCCGTTNKNAATASREFWRGELASMALIVPNPMAALSGKTQNGNASPRCLANTGPRRFLIVECDFKPDSDIATRARAELGMTPPDICAAILLHLAQFAPLVLAVHSGKKSVHGWFSMAGATEGDAAKFLRAACRLGADHALWTRCQLCRMPDGLRESGERQTVYFFNPGIMEGQI